MGPWSCWMMPRSRRWPTLLMFPSPSCLSCQRRSLTLRKIITLRRGAAGRSVAFSDFTSSRNILSVRSLLLSLFLQLLLASLLEMLRGTLLGRRLPPRPSLELVLVWELLLRFRLSTLYPRLLSTLLPSLPCTLYQGLWT